MARLNPAPTRSSTRESSIYRDPTPAQTLGVPRRADVSSRHRSPGGLSDKENRAASERRATEKGHGLMPQSNSSAASSNSASREGKRRRLGERDVSVQSGLAGHGDDRGEGIIDLQFYDPDQDEDLRREVRQGLRNHMRDLRDRRDELLNADNNDLENMLQHQNRLMSKVRQTTDATLDSRYLVEHSNLALRKVTNAAAGDAAAGIDIDEFVAKCVTFMRLGGPAGTEQQDEGAGPATQSRTGRRHAQAVANDDEDEDAIEDVLNWEILGERACIPNIRRPPLPGFLLGPLSVQKRVRQSQTRAPRQRREDQGPASKPQELQAADLQAAENSNLTTLCKNIYDRLETVIEERQKLADEEASTWPDMPEEEMNEKVERLLAKHMITADDGIFYFPFVINPHSFGQTIENLFYVSFLIKDSTAGIHLDENGLPVLVRARQRTLTEQRQQNAARHQAIFSLDYATWQKLIEAYDIQEPMIPHRNDDEGQRITARGWYG